jgi:hypothetical protein
MAMCAYCFVACGSDAHAHVPRCPLGNELAGGREEERGLFPSPAMMVYKRAQAERRRRKVRDFFRALQNDAIRRSTAESCTRLFADYEVDVREIGGPW